MTNKITKEDVINVGNTINKTLTDEDIDWVLKNYESYENEEPHSTWNLIVERMLYDIPVKTYSFHFDQKVTTWMRTSFDIQARNYEEAKVKAIEFSKGPEIDSIGWVEVMDVKEPMTVEDNFGAATEELYAMTGELIHYNTYKHGK